MNRLFLGILTFFTLTNTFAQNRIEYNNEFRAGIGKAPQRHYVTGGETNSEAGYYTFTKYAESSAMPSLYFAKRLYKNWKASLTLSYYRDNDPYINYIAGDASENITIVGGDLQSHYRISPSVQWEWYNKGIVTLYSEVGLTFDIKHKYETLRGAVLTDATVVDLRFPVTPIGITVGRKLFGFAEIFSFGARGFVNCEVGYRF